MIIQADKWEHQGRAQTKMQLERGLLYIFSFILFIILHHDVCSNKLLAIVIVKTCTHSFQQLLKLDDSYQICF